MSKKHRSEGALPRMRGVLFLSTAPLFFRKFGIRIKKVGFKNVCNQNVGRKPQKILLLDLVSFSFRNILIPKYFYVLTQNLFPQRGLLEPGQSYNPHRSYPVTKKNQRTIECNSQNNKNKRKWLGERKMQLREHRMQILPLVIVSW